MRLWKHTNGTFYVLYGPRLKRRVSTRARDRREAEKYLAQFIVGSQEPVIASAATVGSILGDYATERGPAVRSRKTLDGAAAILKRHLGDLKPSHLTPTVIKRYASERGASAGTILREIGVLRAALAWAVREKRIPLAEKPQIQAPVKTPPPRDRWITKDEARALLAECHEPHVRLFVLLGLMTVARMSAILEARWGQVDFERRVIDYGPGHGNKRRAVVPLNDDVFRALQAAKELACSDYVVEFRGKPVQTVKNGFKAACGRGGLSGVTPHILRHSGATWMALDGVPLAEIARMLGDTEATVEKVYAKHHPDYLRSAARALQLS